MKQRIWVGLACILVFTLAGVYSHSQAQQALDYQAMSDKFFSMVQEGRSAEAIDYMFSTNPALKKMTDQTENLKTQFTGMEKIVGPYVSHTKLVESKVAGAFVYQHYFVAYERQPISVRLRYYKPHNTWMAYGIQFDLELADTIQRQSDENLSRAFK